MIVWAGGLALFIRVQGEHLRESLGGKCIWDNGLFWIVVVFVFFLVLVINLEIYTKVSGKTICATGKAPWGGWQLTKNTAVSGSGASRYRTSWSQQIRPEVDLSHSTYVSWCGTVWQSEIQALLSLETQLMIYWSKPDFCSAVLLFSFLERSSTQARFCHWLIHSAQDNL